MGDCSKFLSTLFGTGPQACHRHQRWTILGPVLALCSCSSLPAASRDYPGIKKAGLDRAGCLGYRIGDKCLLGIGSLPIIVLMRTGMTKRRKPKCFFFPTRSGIPSSSTHDPSSNL
ncbi:hypothetical protein NL676_008838 [Syzygium grande]|nr:hypothetical protein NL676_008838 [Syzygium grande]